MMQDLIRALNSTILKQASSLHYTVSDKAPNTFQDLYNSSGLVIWSGASDNTIFNDPKVNWAFRALHDALHLKTGIGFTVPEEIELGRIQASQYTGIIADIVYCEVAGQAEYYLKNGVFVQDQVGFTLEYLKGLKK